MNKTVIKGDGADGKKCFGHRFGYKNGEGGLKGYTALFINKNVDNYGWSLRN